MHDLECEAITKKFGKHTAVDNVFFTVPRGSFFSILGPSGCGKTTLMRMIAGFEHPTSGDIKIKGKSVLATPPNRRPVKMVFQQLALFPMMNVGENIAYGLRCRGESKADISRKVAGVLERVGLPNAEARQVSQLSGGQKQRIAIARCMVLDPDVLLLDEPLGALDLKLRERMKIELKQLQHQFETTFLYITHDQSEALVMSDNVAVMNAGRFEQIGSPQELYHNPKTGFVAGFVGDNNRWRGKVRTVSGKEARVDIDGAGEVVATLGCDGISAGTMVDVFVRPEAISIGKPHDDAALSGTVESLLFNGANSRVLVRTGGDHLVEVGAAMNGSLEIKPGDQVTLSWTRKHCLCFARETSLMRSDATKLSLILLFAPFLLWIGLLIVLPQLGIVYVSLREKIGPGEYEFGFGNYIEFLKEPIYWNTLLRTAWMSLLVTVLALIIGFPVAYYIAKIAAQRSRAALFLMCLIPLWVSDLVRAFGWIVLLRETGLVSGALQSIGLVSGPVEFLYNDITVVVGLVYTVVLFMIVPLVSTLDGMDNALLEAGYNLGGSRFTVFRRIVVPYAMPGIVAGCIIVFMLTAGAYLTPILLGGKNSQWFTEQIYEQFVTRYNWESGATFGVLLLLFTSLVIWLGLKLTGQSLASTVAKD